MALRTVKVRRGNVTELVTGLDAWGIGGVPRTLGVKVIKPCNFNGRHNRSRMLCYLILGHSKQAALQNGMLTSKQISTLTGIPYNSILSRISKWWQWRFVKRVPVKLRDGRAVYAYSLAPRGREWLDRHFSHAMGQLAAYEEELKQKRGYGFWGYLLRLPCQVASDRDDWSFQNDYEEDDDERF